jgi:hypothetical protein
VRLKLDKSNIESRPLWKPMHLQPVFSEYLYYNTVAETLLLMDFVYHLARILLRGSTSNKISYIEFIQQVKHLLFSYFDEIKSIKMFYFNTIIVFLIYYKFIYCE